MIRWLLALLAAGYAVQGEAGETYRRLRGREIVSRFTGMELTDRAHWSYRFEAGGRLRSFALGRAGTGNWAAEGDLLCATRGPGSAPCHEVWMMGTAVQLRRDNAPPEDGILRKPLTP